MANKADTQATATVTSTPAVKEPTMINPALLANMSTFVRNATPGTMIRVTHKGKAKVFEVTDRYAHRGRTGRTILTLKGGKEPLKVGALELIQAFGTEVYFQPSTTPVPVGTEGKKPRTEAEVAAIEAAKVAVKEARKASKAATVRVMGPEVPSVQAAVAEESEVIEEAEAVEPSAQSEAEAALEDSGSSMVEALMESASEDAPVAAQEAELEPSEVVEAVTVSEAVEAQDEATEAPPGDFRSIADILLKYQAEDAAE